MNIRSKVLRALAWYVECTLPAHTEFVPMGNASCDGTQEDVEAFLTANTQKCRYVGLPQNVGYAAGRNEVLRQVRGRFLHFLDNNAYSEHPMDRFFNAVIDKGRLFGRSRLFPVYQFRGMAELHPALKSYFADKHIAELEGSRIVHQPGTTTRMEKRLEIIAHYTGAVGVKPTFYPWLTLPHMYAMFGLRIVKYLGLSGPWEVLARLRSIDKNLVREAVPARAFLNLEQQFGIIAVF